MTTVVDGVTAVDVVQAGGDRVTVVPGLRPLLANLVLSGSAYTCRCGTGDNFALHRALRTAPPGSVLVCDAGGREDGGYFGELMAIDALNRGIRGLVIDGSFRDRARLEELRFPLFGRAPEPHSCTRNDPGTVTHLVTICGVAVATGDWVIGDADALVVVPCALRDEIGRAAQDIQEREATIEAQLGDGRRLWDVLGLRDAPEP